MCPLPQVKRPYPRHPPCAIECRCDGNQVYAQIGSSRHLNLMETIIGYGDDLPSALRALADELEREVGQEPQVNLQVNLQVNPQLQQV